MQINPSVMSISNQELARFAAVEPATIGHSRDSGFLHEHFFTSFKDAIVVGRAVTLKIPALDSTLCHKVIEFAGPGDVLVIDRSGDMQHACLGSAVATAAVAAGISAAIVDGAVTDIGDIRALGFKVFYRRLSALTTRLLGLDGEINTPILCAGVEVKPGDIIVADENGAVILPPKDAIAVMEAALEEQEEEARQLESVKSGVPLSRVTSAGRRFEEMKQKHGLE